MKGMNRSDIVKVVYALLLSLLFWLLNALSGTYTSDSTVEIAYNSKIVDGKGVSNQLPKEVKVYYQDIGRTILWNNIKNNFKAIAIDLSSDVSYLTNGKEGYIKNETLLSKASSILAPSSKLIAVVPNRVYVSFEKHESKVIPIEVDFELAEGMEDYNVTFSKAIDSISITGTKESLKSIHYWKTSLITISPSSTSKTFILDLLEPDDQSIQLSNSSVEVNVFRDQFTLAELIVDIELINVPKDHKVRLLNTQAKLQYQVSISKRDQIKSGNIKVVADFEDVNFNVDQYIDVELITFPVFMKNPVFAQSSIRFILESND